MLPAYLHPAIILTFYHLSVAVLLAFFPFYLLSWVAGDLAVFNMKQLKGVDTSQLNSI